MSTAMPHAGRPAFYTVEQTAWLLGVSTDRIYRAIRTGTLRTVQHHHRCRVPATALTQLLAETVINGTGAGPAPKPIARSGGARQ